MLDFIKEKILIWKFNKKWAKKENLFCNMLYQNIVFWPDNVAFCCSYTENPTHTPIIYKDNLKNFKFSKYLKQLDKALESIHTENSICKGCKLLKKQVIPKFNKKFSSVTITNFTLCNSKCVYCDICHNTQAHYYNILPIIKDLKKNKYLSNDCQFTWGGGEPLIYKEFNDIFDFLLSNKYSQTLNSTGLTFSENVLNGLKQGLVKLQISPDSGTKETYFKVKGQKGYDRVWKNIKKYCEYTENVTVKYIMFSLNTEEKDLREFINKCVESNVKHIEISTEWRSTWGYDSSWEYGKLSQKEIDAASQLLNLAKENNIEVVLSSIWGEDNIKTILNYTKKINI